MVVFSDECRSDNVFQSFFETIAELWPQVRTYDKYMFLWLLYGLNVILWLFYVDMWYIFSIALLYELCIYNVFIRI